jgi:multiple sugar transport system ATP-binding protein
MSFLEIKNLGKSYGAVEVLHNISLTLEEGGFLVLVGPSGCGKSTLLNTIAGLEPLSDGAIHLRGQLINDKPPSARDMAMVFQSYALYPNMTVRDNMAFALEMRGFDKKDRYAAVEKIAKTLQLEHLLDRKPSQLSGGQRQRVAIGRVLVRQPSLYLFDEPLSNLDAKLRLEMRLEMKRLHQDNKATIIYVTHDQVEAMTLATHIAILKGGILQQVGTPQQVYNTPSNTFVAQFIGSPTMNLLTATVVHYNGTLCFSLDAVSTSSSPIIFEVPSHIHHAHLVQGEKVQLGIRPEAISLSSEHKGVGPYPLKAVMVEPTGADTYVIAQLGSETVTARLPAHAYVNVDEDLPLMINTSQLNVFDYKTGIRLGG